jgi:hypothetical protein
MPKGVRHSLARITLRWMVRECFKTKTGIIFDANMLRHEIGLDINSVLEEPTLPSLHPPSVLPSEEPRSESVESLTSRYRPLGWIKGQKKPHYKGKYQEELGDAMAPIVDQLKLHWYWMPIEYIPRE